MTPCDARAHPGAGETPLEVPNADAGRTLPATLVPMKRALLSTSLPGHGREHPRFSKTTLCATDPT